MNTTNKLSKDGVLMAVVIVAFVGSLTLGAFNDHEAAPYAAPAVMATQANANANG